MFEAFLEKKMGAEAKLFPKNELKQNNYPISRSMLIISWNDVKIKYAMFTYPTLNVELL